MKDPRNLKDCADAGVHGVVEVGGECRGSCKDQGLTLKSSTRFNANLGWKFDPHTLSLSHPHPLAPSLFLSLSLSPFSFLVWKQVCMAWGRWAENAGEAARMKAVMDKVALFRASILDFWILIFFDFRVAIFGFRVSGVRCRVSGVGFRVSGFDFPVLVSGFGSRVWGFGLGVWGRCGRRMRARLPG